MYNPEKKVELIEDIADRIILNLENQEITRKQAEEIARRWVSGISG